MSKFSTSSGNLAADRRLAYAEALLSEGDAPAAAALLAETMDMVPTWLGGWYRLGELAEAAQDMDLAGAAYQRALDLDPSDRFGAALRLDLLRPVTLSDRAPAAHVEALFDEYAHRFETSLVQKLNYRGPELLAELLPQSLGRVMDLGCGTGLMGAAIVGRYEWLGGCDLSSGMLVEARKKGLYDQLEKQDLTRLPFVADPFDTVIAADVFIYLGALESVFAWVSASVRPGGLFAFTVEYQDTEQSYLLQTSRRYAHSEAYLRSLLGNAGFVDVDLRQVSLRRDRGVDVQSLCVVARRAASVSQGERDGEAALA